MLLVIMFALAAIIGVGIGIKGLLAGGVQLTRTKTIDGMGGKFLAVICLLFGSASALAAVLTLGVLVFRWTA